MYSDSYPGLPGGGIWECEDELQWRSGSDDPSADYVPRAASRGHVLPDVTSRQTTTPGCQSWEGQDYHITAVCTAQAGGLQQEETHPHGQ